jgi:8-oxo-dGTP diphosphatase
MSTFTKENSINAETMISIFTVDKGFLKVLLLKNKQDPYKGYWILPGSPLKNNETVEDNITDAVFDQTGLLKLSLEQSYTFSNLTRYPDRRVLGISFTGLVDIVSAEIKRKELEDIESDWFKVNDLPKMGFDHEDIILKAIENLKKRFLNIREMKVFFPSDFTLPEIQNAYEQITGKKMDRRNFRKRFLALDLIEETNEYATGEHGRPAKLYRFKDDIKENVF